MTAVLIIGESGSGKTTSIRNLKAAETFIMGVLNKPLPFKNKEYRLLKKDTEGKSSNGNMFFSDNFEIIIKNLYYISDKRDEITTIIIDDFQYMMSNEFMRRVGEKGYDKFSEIGKHAFDVINCARTLRSNLNVYIMCHSDVDSNGKNKCKTIGRMLDDKVCIEGIFTIVLNAMVIDNKYVFLTQNNGMSIAKSPMKMFNNILIDNDLSFINKTINDYYSVDDIDINQ